jgi:aminoglycoside phosphotransferase (APT) family kinase protein
MTDPWTAEQEVSPREARSLIESRFPDLAPATVVPFADGWDNTGYLVNDALVFRFPRRKLGAQCMQREIPVLAHLASQVPLSIPVPEWVGEPAAGFPWPYAGYRLLPGRSACAAHLDDDQRLQLAEPLARFLAALHAISPRDGHEMGACGDFIGKLDVEKRLRQEPEKLARLADLGLVKDPDSLLSLMAGARAARPPEERCLTHGDLYCRHLILDDESELTAIIDWGDVHVGDPAVDLFLVETFLPPAAREVFERTYGTIDEDTRRLARMRAVYHTTSVLLYALDIGDAHLQREALVSLGNLEASAAT